MVANLIHENVWTDKAKYDDAERLYYERLAKTTSLTPLADEVAKARQRLMQIRGTIEEQSDLCLSKNDVAKIQEKLNELEKTVLRNSERLSMLESRLLSLEEKGTKTGTAKCPVQSKASIPAKPAAAAGDDDDDDVDLFGSDSEEESEAAAKIREQRLAAYNEKKSKKAPLIAKSNVILDVKVWDDETDLEAMEKEVRKITTDGLLWGAAKLVPLAYGIHKLQISCVVEDDKVSIDWLQEQIEQLEDYVQSVDIAAFNKI